MELCITRIRKGISLFTFSFFGICTTVTVLIIGLLVLIVIFPIRQIINLVFRYQYSNRFRIMEPMDAGISKDNGPSSMMITGCFLAQVKFGPDNLEKLRSKLNSKIVCNSSITGNYSKLRLVPCKKFGFRCWEDVQFLGGFDIQAHVKLFPGENDWNKVYSEAQLVSIINKAINQKPAKNKPKWEVLVVPQVRVKTSTSSLVQTQVAVIVRVSHGYMDGNYFIKFIQSCIFDDDDAESKIPVQALSQRANWNFSRKAIFYLKMFVFGAFEGIQIRFGKGFKAARMFQDGVGNENNGYTFLGCVKVESDPVRKIRSKANCQTIAGVFGNAFMTALGAFVEKRNMETPSCLNVAFTKVVPAGVALADDMTQNRFALCGRNLPVSMMTNSSKDTMKGMLKTTSDLIYMSPDDEYEAIASFYMECIACSLPDVGIRAMCGLFDFCSCLISLTPISDQMFRFQGGLVTSFYGGPPYGYGTCYSLGISNYGGDFYATLLVEKSSLIQSQFAVQELLSLFQKCLTQLQTITS